MLPVLMGLEGPCLAPEEENLIRLYQPAGFVLFSRNIETPFQTRSLTDSLKTLCHHHPIIAVDQEGGRVVRTAALGLELPSASQVRRAENIPGLVRMAKTVAISLRLLGVNMDLAPVLDICYDETLSNALPSRCWGTTPNEVISMGGMFNRNLLYYGMSTCAKHFPGMGRAQTDPHANLPSIAENKEELLASDLIPFMVLEPELPAIMAAHILLPRLDPTFPATLSRTVITDLLRHQIGYKGIIMTDDLCMGAITQRYGVPQAADMALTAGCDLALICHDAVRHVSEWTSSLTPENGIKWEDSRIRVEKLCRSFPSSLKWDDTLWKRCLNDAQQLANEMLPFAQTSEPASPVQKM